MDRSLPRHVANIVLLDVKIAKSEPPIYGIHVYAKVGTPGWTELALQPRYYAGGSPSDGMLAFDFVGIPPSGIVSQVVTTVMAYAQFVGPLAPDIKGIRVYAENNHEDFLLTQATSR